MLGPLAVIAPLVMAAVLISSAVGKLRHPDDLAGWGELGVPRPLRREWIRQAHPWGELLLGFALVLLGGVLGLLAALVCLALMAAYLWLVSRVVAREEDASCACFGGRKRVTKVTVARNAWLTAVSALTVGVIWLNPLLGGALAATAIQGAWLWVIGAAIAVATALFVVWPESGDEPVPDASGTAARFEAEVEELDYIRRRVPAVQLTLAEGRTVNLRKMLHLRPMLLLSVSPTCGGCEPVIDMVDEWRELLPEVDVRLLLNQMPEDSRLTQRGEPQSLHDPEYHLMSSIQEWSTPTALLLGVDGLLAGGPVTGYAKITEFVTDIHESLHPTPVE